MKDILEGFKENQKYQLEVTRQILELKNSQAKTDEQIKKTGEEILELKNSQAKTDEQMKKTDEQIKKIGEEILELKNSQAKTDEQMKKTDAKLESIGKQLGNMGHNMGEATEELFYRSLEKSPELGHIKFDSVERWIRNTKDNQEIDILLINGECIALIEVKYKAHPQKLHDLAIRKVRSFRENHPQYKKHKMYFGIASMTTNNGLIQAAREEGLYLLTQQGDHLVVANNQVKAF